MAGSLSALLWDVDGTLAETEFDGHRVAFNRSFAAAGLPWHWDRTGPTGGCWPSAVAGRGSPGFLHQVEGRPPEPARVEALQERKQRIYTDLVRRGGLALRPGVERLVTAAAAAGLRQGIVTTSGRSAVEALLQGIAGRGGPGLLLPDLRRGCGAQETRSGGLPPGASAGWAGEAAGVLVLEDSPAGLAAAAAPACPALVCLSAATRDEPEAQLRRRPGRDREPGGSSKAGIRCAGGHLAPAPEVTLSWLQRLLEPT